MKDSGIEWIGEIPEEWGITKVKRESEFINGYAFDSQDLQLEGEYSVIRIGDIKGGNTDFSQSHKVRCLQKDLSKFKIIEKDILIAMSGATVGKLGYIGKINTNAYINQRVGIIRSNISKLLYYNLSTDLFLEYIKLLAAGSAQPNISTKGIYDYKIALPPKQDQQRIATYLVKKVSQIDSIIEKTKQSIEEYKAYKQSLITEVVTKGLDKNVKMKDSGIEWIGEIPEHWGMSKLKQLGFIKGRIGFKGYAASDLVDETSSGRAIVLGGTNIMRDGNLDYSKITYLSKEKYDESPEIMLKGGEVLITKVGAGTGENALYSHYEERVTINPNVMMMIPNDKIIGSLLNYILLSNYVKKDMLIESHKSGAQPAINQSYIKKVQICIPPVIEQDELVRYLDIQKLKINMTIQNKQQLITELESYKKSLIYEVVTGKKEV